MDILFANKKLEELLSLDDRLSKKMSSERRKLIKLRMSQLRAADTLEDMRSIPGARCEALRHIPDKHYLTVRLDNPYRILFEPAHDPVPVHSGGNLDWTKVTAIRILEVGDTHGH